MQIIHRFSSEKVASIIEHLNSTVDLLSPDVSNYARGRERYWLFQEPILSSGRNGSPVIYKPAQVDDRLCVFIRKLVPSVSCALVAKGTGISWHRDAAYADKTAWLLNLGSAKFQIAERRSSVPPAYFEEHQLVGGEFITFDCKRPHRSIEVDDDRWVIVIWQAKK